MKRLFSMIAAPIMAFFAGTNAAAPADSVAATPAAVVQEATQEDAQTPQEITPAQPDDQAPQDGGLSGKVTSIDGSTVTVALAERPALPDDAQKPDGEQPADGQQPPEKPADDANADGAASEKPADDANAPAKPDGEQPADGQQPPELIFSTETVTYDLSSAAISVEENGTVSDGDLSDITVDSVLLLKVDESGTVTEVTVLVQG